MKRKRNPFEVFGLTPRIVADLPDEVLFKLIRSIYRTLQLVHHPDKGGDPKKALELNLAFDKLNFEKDPDGFRAYKKAYVERLSRKTLWKEVEDLEAQNRKLTYILELLKERFWQYLSLGVGVGKEHFKKGLALRINLIDVVSQLNYGQFTSLRRRHTFYKEVWLWKDNLALRKKGNREVFEKIRSYTVLGTIKREHFPPWPLLSRDLNEERMFLKDCMKQETFIKEALFFLTPEVRPNHYLFVYHQSLKDWVFLEGLITKVEEVSAVDFLKHWNQAEESPISNSTPEKAKQSFPEEL